MDARPADPSTTSTPLAKGPPASVVTQHPSSPSAQESPATVASSSSSSLGKQRVSLHGRQKLEDIDHQLLHLRVSALERLPSIGSLIGSRGTLRAGSGSLSGHQVLFRHATFSDSCSSFASFTPGGRRSVEEGAHSSQHSTSAQHTFSALLLDSPGRRPPTIGTSPLAPAFTTAAPVVPTAQQLRTTSPGPSSLQQQSPASTCPSTPLTPAQAAARAAALLLGSRSPPRRSPSPCRSFRSSIDEEVRMSPDTLPPVQGTSPDTAVQAARRAVSPRWKSQLYVKTPGRSHRAAKSEGSTHGSERSVNGKSDSSLSPEERARILELLTFMQGTGDESSSSDDDDEAEDQLLDQVTSAGMSAAYSSTTGAATPLPSPLHKSKDSPPGGVVFELNVPVKTQHRRGHNKKQQGGDRRSSTKRTAATSGTAGSTPVTISGTSTPSRHTPGFAFFTAAFSSLSHASHASADRQQHKGDPALQQHQQGDSDQVRAGRARRSSAPPMSEGMGAAHGLGHALGRMAHWVSGTLLPPLSSHTSNASASSAAAAASDRQLDGGNQGRGPEYMNKSNVPPPSPVQAALPSSRHNRPPVVPARSPTSVDQSNTGRSKFDHHHHHHSGKRPLSAALTTIVNGPLRLATKVADVLSVSRGSTSTALSSTSGGAEDRMQAHAMHARKPPPRSTLSSTCVTARSSPTSHTSTPRMLHLHTGSSGGGSAELVPFAFKQAAAVSSPQGGHGRTRRWSTSIVASLFSRGLTGSSCEEAGLAVAASGKSLSSIGGHTLGSGSFTHKGQLATQHPPRRPMYLGEGDEVGVGSSSTEGGSGDDDSSSTSGSESEGEQDESPIGAALLPDGVSAGVNTASQQQQQQQQQFLLHGRGSNGSVTKGNRKGRLTSTELRRLLDLEGDLLLAYASHSSVTPPRVESVTVQQEGATTSNKPPMSSSLSAAPGVCSSPTAVSAISPAKEAFSNGCAISNNSLIPAPTCAPVIPPASSHLPSAFRLTDAASCASVAASAAAQLRHSCTSAPPLRLLSDCVSSAAAPSRQVQAGRGPIQKCTSSNTHAAGSMSAVMQRYAALLQQQAAYRCHQQQQQQQQGSRSTPTTAVHQTVPSQPAAVFSHHDSLQPWNYQHRASMPVIGSPPMMHTMQSNQSTASYPMPPHATGMQQHHLLPNPAANHQFLQQQGQAGRMAAVGQTPASAFNATSHSFPCAQPGYGQLVSLHMSPQQQPVMATTATSTFCSGTGATAGGSAFLMVKQQAGPLSAHPMTTAQGLHNYQLAALSSAGVVSPGLASRAPQGSGVMYNSSNTGAPLGTASLGMGAAPIPVVQSHSHAPHITHGSAMFNHHMTGYLPVTQPSLSVTQNEIVRGGMHPAMASVMAKCIAQMPGTRVLQ